MQTESPHPPFQFTIKALFALTAFVALTCFVVLNFGVSGLWIETLLVWIGICYWFAFLRFLLPLACLYGIFWGLFFLRGNHPIEMVPRRQSTCKNNLNLLGKALRNYCAKHGTFPQAVRGGAGEQNVASWRVELLPFLGDFEIYEKYRHDQQWNSPDNRSLSDPHSQIWNCPDDHDAQRELTNYVAVTGPQTAWPADRALSEADFPDGLKNTILLVEISHSDIHWMEPRDLSLEQFRAWFGRLREEPELCPHKDGIHVLMADGSVRTLPVDLPPATLDALLTRDGGEKIDWSWER